MSEWGPLDWSKNQFGQWGTTEGWKLLTVGQSGGWVLKNPHYEPSFSSTFDNKIKNKGQAFSFTFAARLFNSYNPAHVPGLHIWQSPGPRPDSKCSRIVEVRCSCQQLKPCQSQIATDEIQEKKNKISALIQSACVSALTGSVPHKMVKGLQDGATPYWNRTHVVRLNVARLNH